MNAQKRINFRRGSNSAIVHGKIGPNDYPQYVLNGRAGQLLSIEITSGNGKVVVNAGTASGKNFSVETGGDHVLTIANTGRSSTTYTLKVSIK